MASVGLSIIEQADFSKGAFRNPSPELIPANGIADAINALLEEDGSLFRRGGSVYADDNSFAQAATFLWDGFTAAGPATLTADALPGNFAGMTPTTGLAWVTYPGSTGAAEGQKAASGNGLVFVPLGAKGFGSVLIWGGSARTANYSTGTITSALLSRTVTGVGTSWNGGAGGNIDAGSILTSGGNYIGVVASVDSATQVTLHDFAQIAVAGAAYVAQPTLTLTPPASGAVSATFPQFVATVGDPARLLVGHRNQVRFTAAGNPLTFAATDYHQMPEGQVVGLAGLQDQAFVFTTAGVYVISNMNFNLIDAFGNVQQRLSQMTKDVILLSAAGIGSWRNRLLVPGVDDVWMMGPAQAPVAISDPIRTLYRSYVQQGYVTGLATVYRNHYVLPIVRPSVAPASTPGTWIDTLVYRLDQGGWTRMAGQGGTALSFATRSQAASRRPALLAMSPSPSRLLDLSGWFNPAAAVKNDADNSTQAFSVTTRDYPTGAAANRNFVKKVRARYELIADAGDSPTLRCYYGSGSGVSAPGTWGAATWGSFVYLDGSQPGFIPLQGSSNAGDGPPDNAMNPFVWLVGQQAPPFFRLRFVSTSPCASLRMRQIDSFIRSRSRQ